MSKIIEVQQVWLVPPRSECTLLYNEWLEKCPIQEDVLRDYDEILHKDKYEECFYRCPAVDVHNQDDCKHCNFKPERAKPVRIVFINPDNILGFVEHKDKIVTQLTLKRPIHASEKLPNPMLIKEDINDLMEAINRTYVTIVED